MNYFPRFNKKGKKFVRHLLKFMKITQGKFKPVIFLIPEDTNDHFIDVEALEYYRKERPLHEYFYGGIALEFGKSVFVFDVKSCDFLKWVRYVGEEPIMEICEIEEA